MESKQDELRKQYESFPYPPVSRIALPRRKQGIALRYELGTSLAWGRLRSHDGIRILVAGAGTLEALVVAQRHPRAKEIIAVDFSQNSLKILKQRYRFAKFARFLTHYPPLKTVSRDLLADISSLGKFDYILASNLLQHVPAPIKLLKNLKKALKPEGLIRLITYPKASRIWMRETSKWLQKGGLNAFTPHLIKRAHARIQELPKNHPVRMSFEIHPEISHPIGLVDAFFNAYENPLCPLELEQALAYSSLHCVAESQNETSRSEFLDEITPELKNLTRWQKLKILDDLLELCANPILWLTHAPHSSSVSENQKPELTQTPQYPHPKAELEANLRRIKKLIQPHRVPLEKLLSDFKNAVGPRVDPQDPDRVLTGLALTDYPLESFLNDEPSSYFAGVGAGEEEAAGDAAGVLEGV